MVNEFETAISASSRKKKQKHENFHDKWHILKRYSENTYKNPAVFLTKNIHIEEKRHG